MSNNTQKSPTAKPATKKTTKDNKEAKKTYVHFPGKARMDTEMLIGLPFTVSGKGQGREGVDDDSQDNRLDEDDTDWWEMDPKTLNPGKKAKANSLIGVRAKASQEITATDIVNLIGMTTMILDAKLDGSVREGDFECAMRNEPIKMYSIQRPVSEFLLKACGARNAESAIASAKRLSTYTVTYEYKDGSATVTQYIYKFQHNAKTKKISFGMSEDTLNYLVNTGWTISLKDLRSIKIKGNICLALWMYLQHQPGERFKILGLAERLGIGGKNTEQRRKILGALNALKEVGYLKSCARDEKNEGYVDINR